jgi:hypothetical protein
VGSEKRAITILSIQSDISINPKRRMRYLFGADNCALSSLLTTRPVSGPKRVRDVFPCDMHCSIPSQKERALSATDTQKRVMSVEGKSVHGLS